MAIGVLTSKRGGRATNDFGGLDVAPGCHCRVQRTWCHSCAIVGCHCSVLWLGERVTTNFGGVDVVPLLGAIARCHCSALSLRGEGDDQLWRSTWCHCNVLWSGGDDQLWGSGRGAIAGCHCSVL